jgi:hypothetical protein
MSTPQIICQYENLMRLAACAIARPKIARPTNIKNLSKVLSAGTESSKIPPAVSVLDALGTEDVQPILSPRYHAA